jgi:sugar phosphate isomerase/epimerase
MLGLQLYTVRSLTETDAACTAALRTVRDVGYECVQLAGKIETVERTARIAADLGIPVAGILVNLKMCEEDTERLFAAARLCHAEDIGISSSIKTEEEARDLIARVNRFAPIARQAGFRFSYHNHSNELIRAACGKTLFRLLVEGFDPETVDFMPDTYWLQHGGADVRAVLESLKGRVRILHLKDMKRTADGPTFAEIGQGNLNWQGILDVANAIGVRHCIVEQDQCDGDPLDSIRMSYEYLKNLNT